MNDPLAGRFDTPAIIALPCEDEPELFFDGDHFMTHLNNTYTSFDVMTYSNTKSLAKPLKFINRLIYGLRQSNTNVLAKEKRYVKNNHVKMFICYIGDTYTNVYLGSQNLTHGTNLNVMYRVRMEHMKPLVDFFEQIWRVTK